MTVSPAPLSRPTALQAAFRTAMGSVCTPVSVVTTMAGERAGAPMGARRAWAGWVLG